MKLSELRPCDQCRGKLAPIFYVVRVSLAVIKADAANATLGLMQMFRGNLGLAEAFSPQPNAITVAGDEEPKLWTELFLCQDCYVGEVNLAMLAEVRNAAAGEE
ncbi:MAG: hypothetical protein KA314_04960 [Chloroflexi bacterium]|nr:hypothetical protein [Chloroflexota bacterium]